MVGESETVSRSFSAAVNSAIWVGGLLAIFAAVFLIAVTFDSFGGKQAPRMRNRNRPTNVETRRGEEEPSMGLTPETVQ